MPIVIIYEPTEKAFRTSIVALAGQIDIIFALGNTRQTRDFVARLKAQAVYLGKQIEEAENYYTETIRTISAEMVADATNARNDVVVAGNKIGDKDMKEIAGLVSDLTFNTIKHIDAETQAGINKIRECFAPIKSEMDKLLGGIDTLRVG